MTADYAFRRCGGCGLVFMDPRPTRAELPTFYPASYHNFDPPKNAISKFLLNRYLDRQAAICRKLMRRDGAMLEVGCAAGDLLERVVQTGTAATVHGIDVSAEACARARDRGLDVFHGTLDEFETDQRYDLIFMSHVIEHVLDPVETIVKVTALLKPGGVLYLETPNVRSLDARIWKRRWGLIHYPRHLYLFDRGTIVRLLETGGLRVEGTASQLNSCGWALSVQSDLRRARIDRSRKPRSAYYPALLLLFLPFNLVDLCLGGTAFMSVRGRKVGG